jgi:glycosyltransferase involved in cell wall biosynthesis
MQNNLMVSVKMITYNHENFIAQAIESILMQETDFLFNLIIADDCSPDNTEEIVKKIISTNPKGHLINYFRHEKNIGINLNGIFGLNQCHGKYIAFCEGDDFWSDPKKLQKQIDILEKDETIGLVHTDYCNFYQNVNEHSSANNEQKKIPVGYVYDGLIRSNFIATVTTVGRMDLVREALKQLKNKRPQWVIGDYPIWLFISASHKIEYIPEITSTYRILSESASNSNSVIKNFSFIITVFKIQLYFNRKIKPSKFTIIYSILNFTYSSLRLILKGKLF